MTHLRFESGGLAAEDLIRIAADMWADLPFDREALAGLKRDGIPLDKLHLGGPSPFVLTGGEADHFEVHVDGPDADTLLDLWRIHFLRGLRPRNLAA